MKLLKLFIAISLGFAVSACGKKDEATAVSTSPLPDISIQCGSTSCM